MTSTRTPPSTADPETPPGGGRRLTTYGVGAAALLVVAAAVGVWWFLGGDAPGEVDAGAALGSTDEQAGLEIEEIDGTWQVDHDAGAYDLAAGSGSFVGFRIDEELAIGGATTAVGRTPGVEASFVVADATLTSATVTADLTQLVTDESRRDDSVQEALGTDSFPTATFELAEPIELGEVPQVGDEVAVTAAGQLTVRDMTQPVQAPLEIVFVSDELALITGSFQIALDDHGIVLPSVPIVISVEDEATVELQLFVARADG